MLTCPIADARPSYRTVAPELTCTCRPSGSLQSSELADCVSSNAYLKLTPPGLVTVASLVQVSPGTIALTWKRCGVAPVVTAIASGEAVGAGEALGGRVDGGGVVAGGAVGGGTVGGGTTGPLGGCVTPAGDGDGVRGAGIPPARGEAVGEGVADGSGVDDGAETSMTFTGAGLEMAAGWGAPRT